MTTTNPNEFWSKIRNIGPRKRSDIPMEVYGSDGSILYDEDSVRNKWKQDFENIYNGDNSERDFDNEFYRRSLNHKIFLESNMLDPLYQCNEELNSETTLDEILTVVNASKKGKSAGIDKIP